MSVIFEHNLEVQSYVWYLKKKLNMKGIFDKITCIWPLTFLIIIIIFISSFFANGKSGERYFCP